jgi:hypothetical protein
MSNGGRADALVARRAALIRLAQLQRDDLGERSRQLATAAVWVERGWRVWRLARAHPLATALPLVAVAMLRPRWASKAIAAAWTLWRLRPPEY